MKRESILKKCGCVFVSVALMFSTACAFGGGESSSAGSSTDNSTSSGSIEQTKDLPFYVDPSQAEYGEFTAEKMTTPYWQGNVIYNETVMLIDDGQSISGKLQYEPVKILSVRDYTWKTEYEEGKDYTFNGKVISLGTDSAIPYLTEENLNGNDLPEGYRLVDSIANIETDVMRMGATIYTEGSLIYGHQVSVSYVYDPTEITHEISSYEAPKTLAKLQSGEDVTIVTTGDSVMEGCSTSGHFNHEPYTKTFMEMVKEGLEANYEGNITLVNKAVGGKTSTWGATDAHIAELIKPNPDILFVHFGINDCGGGASKNMYEDNLEYIIMKVREALPDCEIVLIKAFTPHPVTYDTDRLSSYWAKIDDLCVRYENVTSLDMYTPSVEMLKVKKYMDVTGNGINHLNDFSARLYAMYMLDSLVDYTATK